MSRVRVSDSAAIEREVELPAVVADADADTTSQPVIEPSRATDAATACLAVESLDAYFGASRVVRDASFAVQSGRVTAIIGPSGCGKSTLLRCLNRMHETVPGARVEGEVRFEGRDIYAPSASPINVRRHIGMVFQRPNPFPKTIFENVVYGPKIHGERNRKSLMEICEKSLRGAALWDEVKDRLHSSAQALSGGQQQRLCIARAIAAEPEVLLMDEPCSALDPIATNKIEQLMESLRKLVTIVIVTHNMHQAARVADITAFYYLGKLVEAGPTEKIFSNPDHKQTEDYVTGRFG